MSTEAPTMEREKKKVHRLAKLGIVDFETVAAAARRQQDMLRRLERTQFGAGRLAGLAGCDKNHCGRKKCSEVCQFGTRRRRLTEIPAAHRLFRKSAGPLYEVRIGRGGWVQPAGKLDRVSIAAAKKLNRWALDRLYYPGLIAVGTFKVSVAPKHEGSGWKCEIHQIVSGAKRKDLEKVFSSSRHASGNFLRVKEVTNLGQAISDVLKRDVQGWQHPYQTEITPDRPKKGHRAEYYEWLLGLSADERMVRYGCDRYFNKLKKKPRVFPIKVGKGHSKPIWLGPYMFGSHPSNCTCVRCSGLYPLNGS
jgi:hypothetical protein